MGSKRKNWIILTGICVILIIAGAGLYLTLFGAPNPNSKQANTLVVPLKSPTSESLKRLKEAGYIKNIWIFQKAAEFKGIKVEIKPGGYTLSQNLNVWQAIDKIFKMGPDMKWIIVPEGIRKEQIGELLDLDVSQWNKEGQYFPDTYLIPINITSGDAEKIFLNRFNEVFTTYPEKFAEKNILWTTGLKIASLIERETASQADMPIISGIIWNRLEQGMKLQIDATLQYAKGKFGEKWWSLVKPEDKYIDSPYNTYENKGLPPTPICNPGLDAIKAALEPAVTDCIFYLHDHNGIMHCSKTYEEHLQNIEKYL